jgi:hypothetical protein
MADHRIFFEFELAFDLTTREKRLQSPVVALQRKRRF